MKAFWRSLSPRQQRVVLHGMRLALHTFPVNLDHLSDAGLRHYLMRGLSHKDRMTLQILLKGSTLAGRSILKRMLLNCMTRYA